jgi:hypothetical protein
MLIAYLHQLSLPESVPFSKRMTPVSESVVATTRTVLSSQAVLLEAEEQKLVSELLADVRALLERTRVRANELLNCNVSIMSLPNEILSEILQTYHAQPKWPCRLPAPALLSHVAHRWRDVALSMPLLWTNIHVSPNHPPDQILHYMIRSSGRALHVSVNDYSLSTSPICCQLA